MTKDETNWNLSYYKGLPRLKEMKTCPHQKIEKEKKACMGKNWS